MRTRAWAWGLAGLALLVSMGACSGAHETQVHIRIRNQGPLDIERFWLGSGSGAGGSGSRSYGPIRAGGTTRYRAMPAQYGQYGNFNFIAGGAPYLGSTFSNELIGRSELAPGYYTFVVDFTSGEAVLLIIPEAGPAR